MRTVSQNLGIEQQLTESDRASEAKGAFVQPRKDQISGAVCSYLMHAEKSTTHLLTALLRTRVMLSRV